MLLKRGRTVTSKAMNMVLNPEHSENCWKRKGYEWFRTRNMNTFGTGYTMHTKVWDGRNKADSGVKIHIA